MKKQIKRLMLGMTMVGIWALAGCGGAAGDTEGLEGQTKTPEEYVATAVEALKQADSFTADFRAEVVMQDSGERSATEGKVTFVEEPLYMYVNTQMTFDHEAYDRAIIQVSETYLEESGDAVNLYMNYDGQWTEMTMTEENAMSSLKIYDTGTNLQTILNAAENWQEEAAEGNDVEISAVVPEEKFYAVEKDCRFFQLAGMSGLAEVYFTGVGDVPVTVAFDSKTGEPVSYKIDLAKALETVTNNVLKELNGGELDNGVTVETYTISSELTKLGGVAAGEIPPIAKSDAINYEREISLLESNEK